jgi:hypothetical protein
MHESALRQGQPMGEPMALSRFMNQDVQPLSYKHNVPLQGCAGSAPSMQSAPSEQLKS